MLIVFQDIGVISVLDRVKKETKQVSFSASVIAESARPLEKIYAVQKGFLNIKSLTLCVTWMYEKS